MKKLLLECRGWHTTTPLFMKMFMLLTLVVGSVNGAWAETYTTTWTAENKSYSGGQTLVDDDLLKVQIGAGTWVYNTGRTGITNNHQGGPTFDENSGACIIISPKKKINFTLSTYSSMSNCNLRMYDDSDRNTILEDFRQKGNCTNDFGDLLPGKTYLIYGDSFKATGDLEYVFFQSFTASYSEFTITWNDTRPSGALSAWFTLGDDEDTHYTSSQTNVPGGTKVVYHANDAGSQGYAINGWRENGTTGSTGWLKYGNTYTIEAISSNLDIVAEWQGVHYFDAAVTGTGGSAIVYTNSETKANISGQKVMNWTTSATWEAIPNAGYEFTQWEDGNTSNPRTESVSYEFNHHTTHTATFAKMSSATVTFSAPKVFGWADPTDTRYTDVASIISAHNNTTNQDITSGTRVNIGDEITITAYQYSDNKNQTNGDATINAGRLVLYNWEINGVEDHTNIPNTGIVWWKATSTYTFTVTENIDIKAIYNLNYVCEIKSSEHGSAKEYVGTTEIGAGSGMKEGTAITLVATPDAGYSFDHWEGELYGMGTSPVWTDTDWSTDPTFTFTIDGANTFDYANGYDIKVKPVFKEATYELSKLAETINKNVTGPYTVNVKDKILNLGASDNVTYSCVVAKETTLTEGVNQISNLSASVSDAGVVTIISANNEDGGAVIVTAKINNDKELVYVITVPYIGNHTWDFHRMANKSEHQTTGEYNLEYEVIEGSVHKGPMTVYQTQVKEDNAAVIDATNGLTITNGNKRNMGLSAIGPDGSTTEPQGITAVSDVWLVAIKNSTLTLPQLKKDWFVKMYFLPHAGGTQNSGAGTEFTVNNLSDLNGKAINPEHTLVTNGVRRETNVVEYIHDNENINGCMIFRVTADGDAKFNFSNNGWNKLVKIVVTDTYSTELMLGGDSGNKSVDYMRNNHSWVYREYDSSYGKENTDASIYYNGGPWVNGENAYWINHTISKYTTQETGNQIQGSLSGITMNEDQWTSSGGVNYQGVKISGNQGIGNIKIISYANYAGKVKNNGWETQDQYVLNTNESWIAVGKLKVQKYPYTWDFQSYNMNKATQKTVDKIEENKNTLHADTLYGSWANSKHNRVVWVPGTPDETSPYYSVDLNSKKTYNVKIIKPLFAFGSQLTYGTTTIPETEGLGIAPYNLYWAAPDYGHAKDPVHEQLTLDGNSLKSSGIVTVTIPEVPAGMYVFVNSDKEPLDNDEKHVWKVNAETSDVTFAPHANVNYYKVPETKDVILSFPAGTSIYRIGVTDQIKDITYYGWTTESRAIAIDHNETGSFSAVTKAYKVVNTAGWDKTYDVKVKDGNIVELPVGAYIPAGNGILLENTECTWTKAQGILDKEAYKVTVPLFVPAVNIAAATEADLSGNLLVASTTETTPSTYIAGTTVTDHDQYYTLSNYYYKVHENNDKMVQTKFVSDPAFYRYIGSGTTLVNKAYLKMTLPSSGNAAKSDNKGFDDSDETTGISEFIIDNEAIEVGNDTYYNVSGQALNSIPVQHGIYIKNGKKIYVK